jgi:putative flippase GtrA
MMAPMSEMEPSGRASYCLLPIAYCPPFVRFLALGGFSAGVNLTTRFALQPIVGFEAAVVLAYLTGMVVAYSLFRMFVFGATGRGVATEAIRFAIVNAVAFVLVAVISVGLARVVFPAVGWTWHADDIAHLVGVLSPAVTSWIGHKRYTFGT